MKHLPPAARIYLSLVMATAVVDLILTRQARRPIDNVIALAVFVALTVLGEARPIQAPIGAERVELTVSATFGFAILLAFGPFPAMAAMLVASVGSDVARRKDWWKAAFNGAVRADHLGGQPRPVGGDG